MVQTGVLLVFYVGFLIAERQIKIYHTVVRPCWFPDDVILPLSMRGQSTTTETLSISKNLETRMQSQACMNTCTDVQNTTHQHHVHI